MPATPAWPPKSLPRLFVDAQLASKASIVLEGKPVHYLVQVMRRKAGDLVVLCDNQTGEYHAEITEVTRKAIALKIVTKTAEREAVPDLWLCAAPIKKDRWYMLAEKATELGIAKLIPVRTQRTIIDKVKPEKLRAHMVEAAEQCERTALPELAEMTSLQDLLRDWPEDRQLFFADEQLARAGKTAPDTRSAFMHDTVPAAILIGPEGGFSDDERNAIALHPKTTPMALGPRILRAETAAIAAISVWMARRGDWR